jgi:multiple sugar transport system ATP-binding protein
MLAASAAGQAKVMLIELLGPRAIVTLDAHGTHLTSVVTTSELAAMSVGSEVELAVRPGAAHLFDSATGERLPEA